MEPTHIFFKELRIDKNNVFTANILEKNEVENVIFKKNQEYGITGMAIKPDIVDSDIVKVTEKKKLGSLSERIQELVETKKEPDLDLKIVHTETKTLTIAFKKNQKKIAPPTPIKLVFYNTKTEKNEDILFYNYYEHLKKFGFEWENTAIDFKIFTKLVKG